MRRTARPIYFVCSAVTQCGDLISKTIQAISQGEAIDLFNKDFDCSPQEIFGPFYKKRTQILETTRELKFSSQAKEAIYNDWLVHAFTLREPIDQAFLIFIKRIDNKKLPSPKGPITVPISDLRFI